MGHFVTDQSSGPEKIEGAKTAKSWSDIYQFKKTLNMSCLKIVSEGSGDLLNDLNTATAEMMSFTIGDVGSSEWQIARSRQEHAFEKWHRYINRKPTVKFTEPRLAESRLA